MQQNIISAPWFDKRARRVSESWAVTVWNGNFSATYRFATQEAAAQFAEQQTRWVA